MTFNMQAAHAMQAQIVADAKRIAELEREQHLWRYALHADEINLVLKNEKQRAALKKLGKEKRARVKALVEERSKKIEVPCRYDSSMTSCDYSGSDTGWCKECTQKGKIRKLAREQLHQEGKL
jgi:hypothetical protein